MAALEQLSPAYVERPCACILDAHLAFAPGGLLFAVRLARTAPVWLTRGFWRLVDGADFYRRYPGELASAEPRGARTADILESLSIWHAAWLNGTLDGAFHWIGDARRESALPKSCSVEDINRYEHLAGSLAAHAAAAGRDAPSDAVSACGLEAVALAATLAAEAPLVLTLASGDGDRPPAILKPLAAVKQIKVKALAGDARGGLPPGIAPVLLTARIAGLRTAAVHVFAPRSLAVPVSPVSGDGAEAESDGTLAGLEPWLGTRLFWHEIG